MPAFDSDLSPALNGSMAAGSNGLALPGVTFDAEQLLSYREAAQPQQDAAGAVAAAWQHLCPAIGAAGGHSPSFSCFLFSRVLLVLVDSGDMRFQEEMAVLSIYRAGSRGIVGGAVGGGGAPPGRASGGPAVRRPPPHPVWRQVRADLPSMALMSHSSRTAVCIVRYRACALQHELLCTLELV